MTRLVHRLALVGAVVAAVLCLPTTELAAQEEAGRLSPLDSVKTTLDGAQIEIQYGRPSMRGREIFGGLVPYDEVWRTGANEATHFRTSSALQLGDTRVPAGHYTLYTVPGPEEWTLIVNSQTGQWGTVYEQDRDFRRLPLRVERLSSTVDTFTIRVEEGGDGRDGVLSLEWANTRAWTPIDVVEDASGEDSGRDGS